MMNDSTAPAIVAQAESLLRSLKGIQSARVHINAAGEISHIDIKCPGIDDRSATRNVQSALFAALGLTLQPGMLRFISTAVEEAMAARHREVAVAAAPLALVSEARPAVEAATNDDGSILEIGGAAKRADLNVAARVAFDTLRAAQSSFHGFLFDGAELVRISGSQYVVVAVRRSTTEARYCGAAPVIDSVSTASARALMNAVGIAAMGTPAFEIAGMQQLGVLEA